jgi:hypothetical protein
MKDTVTEQQNEDMILVPRKPTPEMLADGWYGAHDEDAGAVWRLMISAFERSLVEGISLEVTCPCIESGNADSGR